MSHDLLPESRPICGNCGAVHPPNAQVCPSCGVQLAAYRAAVPQIRERRAEQSQAQRERIAQETAATIAGALTKSRAELRRRLILIGLLALGLTGLAALAVVIYAGQLEARRAFVQTRLAEARACLLSGDYACAVEGYTQVLQVDSGQDEAFVGLRLASLGLARQYANVGQWQESIDVLDPVFDTNPDDREALELARTIYARWIQDAVSRGDLVTAWRVQLQQDARFPDDK